MNRGWVRHDAGRARLARRVPTGLVAFAFVLAAFACGEIRPDEIECEEALAHLTHCCPDVDARGFNCEYQTTCGDTLRPSISISTSQCIRDETCDALAASGTCARAKEGNFLADTERGPGSAFDTELCR